MLVPIKQYSIPHSKPAAAAVCPTGRIVFQVLLAPTHTAPGVIVVMDVVKVTLIMIIRGKLQNFVGIVP